MPLSTGTKLGPYEILSPLGSGGMGAVYRARDPRLGRDVAIKVSVERFSDRFEQEARAIAQLNHPHIYTLYDVGPNYLVMELLEGETLTALLRRSALAIEQVLRYGAQVADALAHPADRRTEEKVPQIFQKRKKQVRTEDDSDYGKRILHRAQPQNCGLAICCQGRWKCP